MTSKWCDVSGSAHRRGVFIEFHDCQRVACITILLAAVVAATLSLTGCQSNPESLASFSVHQASFTPRENHVEETPIDSPRLIFVDPDPLLTEADIAGASETIWGERSPAVLVEFDAEGAALLEQHTAGHIEQPIAIYYENELVAAPEVMAAIQSVLFRAESTEHAQRIIERLNQQTSGE